MSFEQTPQQLPDAQIVPNGTEEIHEIDVEEACRILGISEEDETKFFKELGAEELSEVVRISLERSFKNMRRWLEFFLKDPGQQEKTRKTILEKIQNERQNIRDQLSLGYNCSIEHAIKILESQIETGADILSKAGPDEKYGAHEDGMYSRNSSRTNFEPTLGWKPNEVITLAVDDPEDLQHNGSSRGWGEIHFQFNLDPVLKQSTYTMGDSMSSSSSLSPVSNIEDREIAYVHLPLAKALYNLSFELLKGSSERVSNVYIEAQVPKRNLESNTGLQKLTVDRKRLLELVKRLYLSKFNTEVFKLEFGVNPDDVKFPTGLLDTRMVLKKDADNPDAAGVKRKRELIDEEKDKIWDSITDEHLRPLIIMAKSKNIEVVMI